MKPGDRVEISRHPGWTGVVQMVVGDPSGPKADDEIWLDCIPGAVSGIKWAFGLFPYSWEPNKAVWHAFNVFRRDGLTLIDNREAR